MNTVTKQPTPEDVVSQYAIAMELSECLVRERIRNHARLMGVELSAYRDWLLVADSYYMSA